jgi:hypothetical protein
MAEGRTPPKNQIAIYPVPQSARRALSAEINSISESDRPTRLFPCRGCALAVTIPSGNREMSERICNSSLATSGEYILFPVSGEVLEDIMETFQSRPTDIVQPPVLNLSSLESRGLFGKKLFYVPNFLSVLFCGCVTARESHADITTVDLRGNGLKTLDPCRLLPAVFPGLARILASDSKAAPPPEISHLFGSGGEPEPEMMIGPAAPGAMAIDMTQGLGIDIPFMGGNFPAVPQTPLVLDIEREVEFDFQAREPPVLPDAIECTFYDANFEDAVVFLGFFHRTPRGDPNFSKFYAPEAIFSMSASQALLEAPGSPFPGKVRNLLEGGEGVVWAGRDVIARQFGEFFGELPLERTAATRPASVAMGIVSVVAVGTVENFGFVRTFTLQSVDGGGYWILSDQIHFQA